MGYRNIKWSANSIANARKVYQWYVANVDTLAARHFMRDLLYTAKVVSGQPTIGKLDVRRSTSTRKYYSMPIHPKYTIIYRFTSRTLYIVTLHCTLMRNH